MRWGTVEFLGKLNTAEKETFGFASHNYPPFAGEIFGFEDVLTLLIKNIEYRNVKNKFQPMLNKDIKRIKNSSLTTLTQDFIEKINKLIKNFCNVESCQQ